MNLLSESRQSGTGFGQHKMPLWIHHDLDAIILLVQKHVVALRGIFELEMMCDDKTRIDISFVNAVEQRPKVPLHMCLPRLDRKRFIHDGTHRHLVDKSTVYARN